VIFNIILDIDGTLVYIRRCNPISNTPHILIRHISINQSTTILPFYRCYKLGNIIITVLTADS